MQLLSCCFRYQLVVQCLFLLQCISLWPSCMSHTKRKPDFCLYGNKAATVAAQLISAYVFAAWIVHFLIFLNQNSQASGPHLRLHRLFCVGPGQKSGSSVFSSRGSSCIGLIRLLDPYQKQKKNTKQKTKTKKKQQQINKKNCSYLVIIYGILRVRCTIWSC